MLCHNSRHVYRRSLPLPRAAGGGSWQFHAAIRDHPLNSTNAVRVIRSIVELTGATGGELLLTDGSGARTLVVRSPETFDPGAEVPDYRTFAGPGGLVSGRVTLYGADRLGDARVEAAADLLLVLFAETAEADAAALTNERDRLELSAAAANSEQRFRILADTMPQIVWSTLPDGYHDYYNRRWYEYTGVPDGSTDGEGWNGMFHHEDRQRAWERWRHSLETGEQYEIEYRLRDANGDYRWTLGRALPMRDDGGNIVRWFGTCTDIHEQKLLLEQRQLVTQELSHRIKNIFSIVAGLISLSSRRNPEAAKPLADIRARILALGRAHDFVRPHSANSAPSDEPATLQSLLRELLAPYQTDGHDRVVVSGADFSIDDQSTTPIALAFHELATNAAKYGGLSVESGRVALEIAEQDGHCVCRWTERSGPAIESAPEPRGFGTSLIDMSITRQLGGRIDRAWDGEGLTATLSFPIKALQRKSVTL